MDTEKPTQRSRSRSRSRSPGPTRRILNTLNDAVTAARDRVTNPTDHDTAKGVTTGLRLAVEARDTYTYVIAENMDAKTGGWDAREGAYAPGTRAWYEGPRLAAITEEQYHWDIVCPVGSGVGSCTHCMTFMQDYEWGPAKCNYCGKRIPLNKDDEYAFRRERRENPDFTEKYGDDMKYIRWIGECPGWGEAKTAGVFQGRGAGAQ